jgi:hypothetical protein
LWERPSTRPFTAIGELMYIDTSFVCQAIRGVHSSACFWSSIAIVPLSKLETSSRSPTCSGVTMFWSQGVTNGRLQRTRPDAGSTPRILRCTWMTRCCRPESEARMGEE